VTPSSDDGSVAGASCFRHRELPGAVHDFGRVLWEFREFAAIRRSAGVVPSVVSAIDRIAMSNEAMQRTPDLGRWADRASSMLRASR
jgi:hypothetical protein